MAVQYTATAIQTVPVGQNAVFTDTRIPCTKGYVLHRDGSGNFTLRGITNQCRARYVISFSGNIAVPDGETPEEISLALAIDGEPDQAALLRITTAIADRYFNVASSPIYVDVPKCCCTTVSVRNTSDIPVNVQNLNITIDRVA